MTNPRAEVHAFPMAGKIHIGTSGWMYKDWGKEFYPEDMKEGFLTYLAGEFDTVEVNSSFYHLPLPGTFVKWGTETPSDFVFAVKLSRYITHRSHDTVKQAAYRFLSRAKRLGKKLGPVLVQLPPYRKFDQAWATRFLDDLVSAGKRAKISVRFALEPRHRTWLAGLATVRALAKERGIALVFPHSAKIPSIPAEDENVTSDFVYVRFHGPSEFAASRYGSRQLRPWANKIKQWSEKGIDVFCYFNNDVHGHAVHDARALKSLVGLPQTLPANTGSPPKGRRRGPKRARKDRPLRKAASRSS